MLLVLLQMFAHGCYFLINYFFHFVSRTKIACFVGVLAAFYVFSLVLDNNSNNNNADSADASFNKLAGQGPAVFLVILIPSSPPDSHVRDDIRATWLNYQSSVPEEIAESVNSREVRHFFVVATKGLSKHAISQVVEESLTFHDMMLIEDVVDSYNNLSMKLLRAFTLLGQASDPSIINIAIGNKLSSSSSSSSDMQSLPASFEFLAKVDTDSFVNIPALVHRLTEDDVAKNNNNDDPFYLYLGYFMGSAPVFHNGKWADPDWNSCDTYTPYAGGGGYVLSLDAVKYIAQNANMLRVFVNEDTNIGFWLAPLKAKFVHDRRFNSEFMSRGCRNNFVISHAHTREEIRDMYDLFVESGGRTICKTEQMTRRTYDYNWAVVPFKCCNMFVDE